MSGNSSHNCIKNSSKLVGQPSGALVLLSAQSRISYSIRSARVIME
jgi:hypothetical protein